MADNLNSFQWSGIDSNGKRVSGMLDANDSVEAQQELKRRGIEITALTAKKKSSLFSLKPKPKKIKHKDILLLTRYISTMLAAGLPIVQALDIISHDQENPSVGALVVSLKNSISGGKTLADSFSEYPQHFNDMYCNLIKAGEKSGTIDKILKRLADYMEKTETLKRKVKKALVYPAAIMSIALIVSLVLLIFVVPKFADIFSSFGAKLPAFTRGVMALSDFIRYYWYILSGLIIGGYFGLKYYIKQSEPAKIFLDKLSLRMYIIGPVLRKSIIARFTRTLATTLDAGMPIVESMRTMAPIMGSRIYTKAVYQICDDVSSGHALSVSMESTNLFPNMAIQMISVGEASGSLSEMLNKVADYYEEEVNAIVDNLSSLLEPLIMLVLGVVIGTFVIAMYLPIFKLGSLV